MKHTEPFILYKEKADFDSDLANNNINKSSIAFIEESGNEAIYTQNKKFTFIPSGGTNNSVLISKNGKPVWSNISLLDSLSYGVEWDENQADPHLKRIGNIKYHKELPIQSQIRGCVYNPVTKVINYWLNNSDWHYKEHSKDDTTYKPIATTAGNINEIQINSDLSTVHIGQYIIFNGTIKAIAVVTSCNVNNSVTTLQLDFKSIDNNYTYEQIVSNLTNSNGTIKSNVTVTIGSNLSGYDGEVMVYVPSFYIKSWEEGTKKSVRISTYMIDDTWEYQPPLFLSAYRSTVLNTVPANMGYLSSLPANSAITVCNDATYCRGGNNNSTNDSNEDIFKRHLGKCRTNISKATFRTYARNAGKEIMSYKQYKNIMYWLYVIEYANFNSQAPYNDEITAEGFHQGGLGNGITNVSNWNTYNSYYPISINGYTNEFGNGTAVKLIKPSGPAPVGSVYATRWRGIENLFGDVWHNVDGIIIDANANNHPNNMNYVYTTDDPTKYGDTLADMANMVLSGLEIHLESYIKEWDLGTTAEIIPTLSGGNGTQYKCDYHWTGSKNSNLRTLLIGGRAGDYDNAGLGCFYSDSNIDIAYSFVSYRTSVTLN